MKSNTFTKDEIKVIEQLEKFALISCINHDGLPHLTLINTLIAQSEDKMTLGQFVRGLSKWYIQQNPNIAFFILMPRNMKILQGTARWTHKKFEGPQLDKYKNMPMQRYNSYFPVHTVHYLDLVDINMRGKLPVAKIIPAALKTRMAKVFTKTGNPNRIMNEYAVNIFNDLTALKFISYVRDDGFPELIPVLQCQASDSRRLTLSHGPYKKQLQNIPAGKTVAIMGIKNPSMESVLIRGTFNGFKRHMGMKCATVDINCVYNSMCPNSRQIYPEVALKPVVNF